MVLHLAKLCDEYTKIGEYGPALLNGRNGISIFELLPDTIRKGPQLYLLAQCYNNIGNVFREQGDYLNALDNYFKSLKIKERVGNKKEISITLNNMGIVYKNQGDFTKALENYFKALKIDEELKNKRGIATKYGNIGVVYFEEHDHPKALQYWLQALKLDEQLNNKTGIARHLGNIGNVYYDQLNYTQALKYYTRALKINQELDRKNGIAIWLGNIGSVYIKQKKYVEAESYLLRSLKLSDSIHALNLEKDQFGNLSDLYAERGDYKKSLVYYKKFVAARDTIANDENIRKQTRIEMKYVFNKQQTTDSIRNSEAIKRETLKHEQEIHQQRIYTYGGGIGFALMLIIASVSLWAFRQKRNANAIISHQKYLVEEKQKEILDSIHYAKRIQRSLLPTEKYINKNINRLLTETT